jgi:hypothetical protein
MGTPRLSVQWLPELGAGARTVTVECPAAKTVCTIISPYNQDPELATAHLKAATLYRHEDEHPDCETEGLWAAHGLLALRRQVDEAWDAMRAEAARERRN